MNRVKSASGGPYWVYPPPPPTPHPCCVPCLLLSQSRVVCLSACAHRAPTSAAAGGCQGCWGSSQTEEVMIGGDGRTLSCLWEDMGKEPEEARGAIRPSMRFGPEWKRERGREGGKVEGTSQTSVRSLWSPWARVSHLKRPRLLGIGLLEYPCLLRHWLGAACGTHGLSVDMEWISECNSWGSFPSLQLEVYQMHSHPPHPHPAPNW